jgi:hypothetical protein
MGKTQRRPTNTIDKQAAPMSVSAAIADEGIGQVPQIKWQARPRQQ